MTPLDWSRLEQLFEEALALDAESRGAFVDERCGDDTELREQLLGMLADHDERPMTFERRLLHDNPDGQTAGPVEGTRIGVYRLTHQIGVGGMGEVYAAEREDDQYRQTVAIKLVRAGIHGADARNRFLQERQILARLQHPNIAQLLDGGVTDDGRPYLVMQQVDGQPITDYCVERELSVDDRLELFRQVGLAVQHAHGNLVIHRDIKPSNILVAADGAVSLLDFGIAKLIEADPQEGPQVRTRTEVRVLTPEHAAPEQIRGEPVTTATDVYTLGVLLYEMLAGRRPHDEVGSDRLARERSVCETIPKSPSSSAPPAVRRHLRGDLDNIVLKALEKQPERRYSSVAQMLEDIERHRSGQPIEAHPGSMAYRAGKFVRRHRFGVTAAAAIAVLIVGFGVVTWRQSRAVALQRDRAERTAEFLTDLFAASRPDQARGAEITARELLDRGAEKIGVELADSPDLQAHMMTIIGGVYADLGLFESAEPLLLQAIEIGDELYGADGVSTLESKEQLGLLYRSLRRLDEAEQIHLETSEARRRVLGPSHHDTLKSIVHLANVYGVQRRHEEAEPLFEEAVAGLRATRGDNDPETIATIGNLAIIYRRLEKLDEAEALMVDVLENQWQSLGDDHPLVATSLNNIGNLYLRQERNADAEKSFLEAVATRKKVLGEDHPLTLAAQHNLARTYKAQGRMEEAELLAVDVLGRKIDAVGWSSTDTMTTVYLLGALAALRGDPDVAIDWLQKLIEQDPPSWIRDSLGQDEDLVSLRDDPRFQALVAAEPAD